ncbi:flagellar motor switch protein FliG [Thermodesulfobacteriota bacterium]
MAQILTGKQKAAVFLMIMGEDFTSKVFKHLDTKEIKALGQYMAQIKKVDPQTVSSVLEEVIQNYSGDQALGLSGANFFEKTVSKTFDSRKADSLLSDVSTNRDNNLLEKLKSLNPLILSNLLANEHPQTIALVLVNMEYDAAAELLPLLPENIQSEVIVRIAELENVPYELVHEIQDTIIEQISDVGNDSVENLGGIQSAAEILNQVDQKTESAVLEKIESEREELADEIRQKMFVFEDLVTLDNRSIRTILKEISNEELMMALKTASEELSLIIFDNMSQRAAQILKEDMEVMGPVKLRDVELAQQNIIKTTRRLEEEGKLVMGNKGGDDTLV